MHRTLPASLLLSAFVTAQGWTDHTPLNPLTSPGNRAFPAMCWDAAHGAVLMFGGNQATSGSLHDTWTWNGTAWNQIATTQPTSGPGSSRPDCAMAFHAPSNQVVLVYGGSTFVWTGANWVGTPATISFPLGGTPVHVAMAYDPVHQQTVLYVGVRMSSIEYPLSATYTWDGPNWTQRTTGTVPYPFRYPAMAFDPLANRVVLTTSDAGLASYYEWTGTNWQQRLPAGGPSASGAMATDTASQRLVLLDGVINAQPGHTWNYANGALQQLVPPIEPARRFGAAMAYDPARNRVVLFGGTPLWDPGYGWSQLAFGDTWEFELGQGATYTILGTGCPGSRGVPMLAASLGAVPHAGQPFQAVVTNVPLQGPVFLFLGLSNTSYGGIPLPFGLGVLGAPGCDLLCSGDDMALLPNVLGTAYWQWNVPNVPGATFYNQAVVFDATANPLGLTLSNGAAGTIGL